MINKFLITGDCHGNFSRLKNLDKKIQKDNNIAIIILGDVGINIFLNENDNYIKNFLSEKYNITFYCLHGNHEARPTDLSNIQLIYDDNIKGEVYIEPKWNKIRYLKDWGIYQMGKYKVAVIGGAYSVDKFWRLQQRLPWFANEQLTEEEIFQCKTDLYNKNVDFVLTHTCPYSIRPTDLFLNMIDQTTVDNTMEKFLDDIANNINWKIWCFGHYHDDRIERPYMEMFYNDIDNLDNLYKCWDNYKKTGELNWWLRKSPQYFMGNPFKKDKWLS